MGVTLIAPEGVEHIVMGNEERTPYKIRSRVVEVHPAHVAALKMQGFREPVVEKPKEVGTPATDAELIAAAAKAAPATVEAKSPQPSK